MSLVSFLSFFSYTRKLKRSKKKKRDKEFVRNADFLCNNALYHFLFASQLLKLLSIFACCFFRRSPFVRQPGYVVSLLDLTTYQGAVHWFLCLLFMYLLSLHNLIKLLCFLNECDPIELIRHFIQFFFFIS